MDRNNLCSEVYSFGEEYECRFCHEGIHQEQSVEYCDCTSFAHRLCVERWVLAHSVLSVKYFHQDKTYFSVQCSLCHQPIYYSLGKKSRLLPRAQICSNLAGMHVLVWFYCFFLLGLFLAGCAAEFYLVSSDMELGSVVMYVLVIMIGQVLLVGVLVFSAREVIYGKEDYAVCISKQENPFIRRKFKKNVSVFHRFGGYF